MHEVSFEHNISLATCMHLCAGLWYFILFIVCSGKTSESHQFRRYIHLNVRYRLYPSFIGYVIPAILFPLFSVSLGSRLTYTAHTWSLRTLLYRKLHLAMKGKYLLIEYRSLVAKSFDEIFHRIEPTVKSKS